MSLNVLHIEEREIDGITILDLKGPLTLGHGDLELRDRLPPLHEAGKANIVRSLKHFDVLSFVQQEGHGDATPGVHAGAAC